MHDLNIRVQVHLHLKDVISIGSKRSCIRDRSVVGRAERGLVSGKDGGRSGRAGFERWCIRDTARRQRVLIGDRYALHSERVIFYPIIPDQAMKIGRHWS